MIPVIVSVMSIDSFFPIMHRLTEQNGANNSCFDSRNLLSAKCLQVYKEVGCIILTASLWVVRLGVEMSLLYVRCLCIADTFF